MSLTENGNWTAWYNENIELEHPRRSERRLSSGGDCCTTRSRQRRASLQFSPCSITQNHFLDDSSSTSHSPPSRHEMMEMMQQVERSTRLLAAALEKTGIDQDEPSSKPIEELRRTAFMVNATIHAATAFTKNREQLLESTNSTADTTSMSYATPYFPSPVSDTIQGIPLVKYARYNSEFEEKCELGKGGFGTVYAAQHSLDGRMCAVKKVLVQGGSRLKRVLREVQNLACLDHPHVVRYYAAWLEIEEEDDNTAPPTGDYHIHYNRHIPSFDAKTETTNYYHQDIGFDFESEDHSTINQAYNTSTTNGLDARSWSGVVQCLRTEESVNEVSTTGRIILYISMQLCETTLRDFLEKKQKELDIPQALGMFLQIARGVQHIHEQELVHRDLKPCNCFIDSSGVLKVGDFGLSRGMSAKGEGFITNNDKICDCTEENQTVGVGTPSYASPEQMSGSDYDASTDIFSLGIMLFEMCYPMHTGMERSAVLKGLRTCLFPKDWLNAVRVRFPSVHKLMYSMLSSKPCERPSCTAVVDCIDSILSQHQRQHQHTVLFSHQQQGRTSVVLRIEASSQEETILTKTMSIIRETTPFVDILQYGLQRTCAFKVIMEFVVAIAPEQRSCGRNNDDGTISAILGKLRKCNEIKIARQISR